MKKKKRDTIEIAILLIIAILGVIYVCRKENEYDERIHRLYDAGYDQYRSYQLDDRQILIPLLPRGR